MFLVELSNLVLDEDVFLKCLLKKVDLVENNSK